MPQSRSEVVAYYKKAITDNEILTDEVKEQMRHAIDAIAMQFYNAGVKAGYLKILVDHRAGHVDLSLSTPKEINELIRKAQEGELMPGRDLPSGN